MASVPAQMKRAIGVAAVGAVLLVVAGCGSSGPASTDILFVSTRDGDYALYGMSADGGGARRLTEEAGDPSSPSGLYFQVEPDWSPDGTRIAFASKRDGHSHVFVMLADGSGTKRLTSTDGEDGQPTWSPDGRHIAFSRSDDIYVIAADGTGARRLGSDSAEERDPAWSPDGRWIAYVRRTPGTTSRDVWLVRPDGSGRRRLTTLNAASFSPAWSPDGGRIVFSTDAEGGAYDLYVIRRNGEGLRRLTSSEADAFEPAWSPDGTRIAFSRDGSIFTIGPAGGSEDQLTDGGNDSEPAWRPPTLE